MENIITKIELNLAGKTISLTLDQAKKLRESLNELFAEKVVREVQKEYVPYYPYHWYWQYREPLYHSTQTPMVSWNYCSQNTAGDGNQVGVLSCNLGDGVNLG